MREIKYQVYLGDHEELTGMHKVESLWWNDRNELIVMIKASYPFPNRPEYRVKDEEDVFLREFTGLHDRNGTEIYEGDIFQKGELKGIIEWKEAGWGYHLINPMLHMGFGIEEIEIIGNRFENPELLEAEG